MTIVPALVYREAPQNQTLNELLGKTRSSGKNGAQGRPISGLRTPPLRSTQIAKWPYLVIDSGKYQVVDTLGGTIFGGFSRGVVEHAVGLRLLGPAALERSPRKVVAFQDP